MSKYNEALAVIGLKLDDIESKIDVLLGDMEDKKSFWEDKVSAKKERIECLKTYLTNNSFESKVTIKELSELVNVGAKTVSNYLDEDEELNKILSKVNYFIELDKLNEKWKYKAND